jgi:SEC-C motif-containing protein
MGRRRGPRRVIAAGCPCGLPATYDACCGRFSTGAAAPTAELLMRSRYTAYVRGDEAHLLASWHPSTRPAVVELDPALSWTGLEVLAAAGGLLDAVGSVSFRASHVRRGVPGVLKEHSRFARDRGRWAYVAPLA